MENRTSKRIPINLEASLTWGGGNSKAFIGGVSENGLYVIAESGANDSAKQNERTLMVKFNVSPEEVLELPCRVAWSNQGAYGQSLDEMGLVIKDPPSGFKKFYKSSFYKIKTELSHDAIAVVGMSCYYPGAPDLKSFWENILARRREFRMIPEQRLPLSEYYDPDPSAPDKTYANRAAVIDGFEFDWVKRGIPKSVVESSDIVHWLALEVALRAMEDAGLGRGNIPSDRSGVILGNTLTGEHSRSQQMRLRWPYVKKVLTATATKKGLSAALIGDLLGAMEGDYKSAFAPVTEDTLAGNLSNTIAGRICNFLDMHGGGYTVDGACSSSLIAVATAANALSVGTLDLAVAGGIDISLDTFELVGFAKANALTKADMKVYDRRASGFIPGEGAGFVVLKRLQDARADGNYVYAVLKGWGVSSDGKGGMTAPKAQSQTLAIRRAYGKAGYGLDKVDFIEGHGTGTTVGDKAELEGIGDAMNGENGSHLRECGITSLKSLIGHTKAASGIGGFIKTVMAVNRRVVPPIAGCSEPNSVFSERALGLYPVMEGQIRNADSTVRAGVSGMGFGGINCHVTVESAGEPAERLRPSIGERELLASHQETELFVFSARSRQEMAERVRHLKELAHGISIGEMVDLSRELTREDLAGKPFRAALVAGHPEGLADCLERIERMIESKDIEPGAVVSDLRNDIWAGNPVCRPRVGFLFSGQGSQQLNMGRSLVERHQWARDIRGMAKSIAEYVYRPVDRAIDRGQIDGWKEMLSQPGISQPAICMASLLWIRHLENLGIRPSAVGGHSLGELTAFHAAGAFDDKTLLEFAAFRGRETSAPGGDAGVMAVLACGRDAAEEVLKRVDRYAVIANINGPSQTVISGDRAAVEKAVRAAALMDIKTKRLPVANAFHSRYMARAAGRIKELAPIPDTLAVPAAKLLSSMDGTEIMPGTDLRRHFARQVTHPVDFISLVNNIRRETDLLVEVGPGRVLSDLVNTVAADEVVCFPVESRAGDFQSLNVFLGCYFVRGGEVNWAAVFENRLVRPFVPAAKRNFIDNPCERISASADSLEVEHVLNTTNTGIKKKSVEKEKEPLPSGEAGPEILLHIASRMTGFPIESISLEHRLLDDLNLDSIKAGHLIAKALKQYGVEAKKVDPTTMANNSLREIYERIRPHASAAKPASAPADEGIYPAGNWVRNFRIAYAEHPRASCHSRDEVLMALSAEGKHVLLVSESVTDVMCMKMSNIFRESGVAASAMNYREISRCTPDDYTKYDYFIFLLPVRQAVGLLIREQVHEMASRLHCIAKVVSSLRLRNAKPAYAVVQFGTGGFYKSDATLSPESLGGSAFLCSLHQEMPGEKMRVLQFCDTTDASGILRNVMEELRPEETFGMAVFDDGFKRYVPTLELISPDAYIDKEIEWTRQDVVLVTGGARGITAECALAFAIKNGVKLALVGSTTLIEKDEEIQGVLQRYLENGVTCRYYACDITDKAAVAVLKERIEQELGVITAVIHGAAANRPRPTEQVSFVEAKAEIAPKIYGAINICEALKENPLKLFVGFGSIIGVTGMKGNAWYGFSNEVMSLILQQFKTSAGLHVVIPSFSIWDEVGMGARMGSLSFLSKMGVRAIPRLKGIERFLQLTEKSTGEEQVVVAGRLAGIDTIKKPTVSKPSSARFLEEVFFYAAGVEIEARAILSLDADPYLNDHVFRGTCLLPAVFGIEAMAQAVSAVTGIRDFGYLRLDDVLLNLPITVEPGNTTEIRIHALVEETADTNGIIRVKAGITAEQTQFRSYHFEAAFVLGLQKSAEQYKGALPDGLLDIPREDLYGHVLFQGSSFQRIESVHSLDDKKCVFNSRLSPDKFLTKDPFFRDTLLQSVQIILPDIMALPIKIDTWEIFLGHSVQTTCKVVADLADRSDEIVKVDVAAIDERGMVVEKLHGYQAKIIGKVKDAPLVDDLKAPDDFDESMLNNRLQYYCRVISYTAPAIAISHKSNFHGMDKVRRHEFEKGLFEKACRGDINVEWTKEGKPFVKGNNDIGLSCSHDDRVCLCVAGRGPQGCDIEELISRSAEQWRELLGGKRAALLELVTGIDKSADRAGARIWCALEALRKATDMKETELRYEGQTEDCLIFEGGNLTLLTFPVRLLRGRERMVAVTVAKEANKVVEDAGRGQAPDKGPKGQRLFAQQFPLGLKDSSTVAGGVYFASYFHWLGTVRETALKPIGKYIADEFHNGHFMATNFTEMDISGHVGNHEVMNGRVWVDRVLGNSMTLHFDWGKVMPGGTIKQTASSRQQVSWIKVIGHGIVEPVPMPEFFLDFLGKEGLLPEEGDAAPDEKPEKGRRIYEGLGDVIYESELVVKGGGILDEIIVDTTMLHSNLAQNVYFSNYFSWQGHLRDRYLYKLSPEQYRKMDRHGKFACIHSEVKHLREALPFDRVSIEMKLNRVFECGIELYFEYFKLRPDGEKIKLAYGDHTLAWVQIDGIDGYAARNLPEVYLNQILEPRRI